MKETTQSKNVVNKRKALADAGTGFSQREPTDEANSTGTISKESSTGEESNTQPLRKSLLEGTYDESASAAYFQQALMQWRTGQRMMDNEQRSDNIPSKCFNHTSSYRMTKR